MLLVIVGDIEEKVVLRNMKEVARQWESPGESKQIEKGGSFNELLPVREKTLVKSIKGKLESGQFTVKDQLSGLPFRY